MAGLDGRLMILALERLADGTELMYQTKTKHALSHSSSCFLKMLFIHEQSTLVYNKSITSYYSEIVHELIL